MAEIATSARGVASSLTPVSEPPAPAAPSSDQRVYDLVDKWWADNVAVLQRSVVAWEPAVEAKVELAKRIIAAGPDLFK